MAEGTATATKRDWGLFFAGALIFISGLVVLFWPGLSLVVIAQIAGALLVVGGIFDFVSWRRLRNAGAGSAWALVNALCSLILGLMFLLHPIVTASVIPFIAGIFVAAYGIMAIIAAFNLRGLGSGWGLMLVNGIVSVLCGFMFAFMPESFAIFLGIFLMMRGVTMCVYGLTAPDKARVL